MKRGKGKMMAAGEKFLAAMFCGWKYVSLLSLRPHCAGNTAGLGEGILYHLLLMSRAVILAGQQSRLLGA